LGRRAFGKDEHASFYTWHLYFFILKIVQTIFK